MCNFKLPLNAALTHFEEDRLFGLSSDEKAAEEAELPDNADRTVCTLHGT